MGRNAEPQPTRIVAISPDDGSAIDLRNPALAAVLSWAVPGLGQLYQGRTKKGSLFMAAILTTFVLGLWLGGGKVVYASWKPGDTRWAFVCQAGAGLVAMPDTVAEDSTTAVFVGATSTASGRGTATGAAAVFGATFW